MQRHAAQTVGAADDGRVADAARDQWDASMNVLRAGGAGRRDDHRRTAQSERRANKAGQREHVLRVGIVERRRQCAGVRIARAVGVLAGQDARRAGAKHHRDAVGAIPAARSGDGVGEAVGVQCKVGQPVVAAVEARQ